MRGGRLTALNGRFAGTGAFGGMVCGASRLRRAEGFVLQGPNQGLESSYKTSTQGRLYRSLS